MWAHQINGNDYYREENSLRGIPCSNPKRYVRAEVVDSQVSQVISELKLPESWRQLVMDLLSSRDEWQKADRERARLEEKLRRLRRQYREVEIGEEEYKRELVLAQATLDAIRMPSMEQTTQLGDNIEGFVRAWSEATKVERRDMVRIMLEAVYIDMEAQVIVALKPKPSFLSLFKLKEPITAGGIALVTGDPDRIRTGDLRLDRAAC